jgi:hypothetical protein
MLTRHTSSKLENDITESHRRRTPVLKRKKGARAAGENNEQ